MSEAQANNPLGDEAHSGRRGSLPGHPREACALDKFLAEGEAGGLIEKGNQEASAIERQGEGLDRLQ